MEGPLMLKVAKERGAPPQKAWGMREVAGGWAQSRRKDSVLSGSWRRVKEHREPEGLGRFWLWMVRGWGLRGDHTEGVC